MAVPGDPLALLRPGEAASAIGVKPSTLRVYVQRFAELLSEDASGDRPGYRFYSARDVELLRHAKDLLGRGFTYERTIAELRGQVESAQGRSDGRRARGRRAEIETVQAQVANNVQILEHAVQAWRDLAEERSAEIADLRDQLRRLQELVLSGRRSRPQPRHRQKVW
jgi:DNA-binding transcriptional MerR regulator